MPARALPDLAVRLITGLAAGDTSAAFRAAVAQLALPDKQKLQVRTAAAIRQTNNRMLHEKSLLKNTCRVEALTSLVLLYMCKPLVSA